MKIKWFGMSAFLLTAENGVRIVMDPFVADKNILYPEIREQADVITISCGHFSHCNVYAVEGSPYVYKGPGSWEFQGIKFHCVASEHLPMDENKRVGPGKNNIICVEIDGIKVCHLGALGYKLTQGQVEEIGKVDILLIPVGGRSTLPLEVANRVCRQLNPRIIFPMHYKSERCTFQTWHSVDEFLKDKENITRMGEIGCCEMEFSKNTFPLEPRIIVLRSVY